MYQVEKLEEEQAKQKEQKEQHDGEEVRVVLRGFHGMGCLSLFDNSGGSSPSDL